jgi:hypothetical protein
LMAMRFDRLCQLYWRRAFTQRDAVTRRHVP